MQSPQTGQYDTFVKHTEQVLVIVGGGDFDPAILQNLADDGALVVGADGGADAALAAGVMPELVIGDLDSLMDVAAWRARTRVIELGEQETTDFEKCLYSVHAPVTVALGMTGKRFDHTLAALHAVTRFGAGRQIILVDEVDAALTLSGPVTLDLPEGARVSVHPLQPVRFRHSDGLVYPLDGLTLSPGLRTGASNAATGGTIRIVPDADQNGVWLLILPVAQLAQLVAIGQK